MQRPERSSDEDELPQSEPRMYRQLVGKLLWIDRANLRCAMSRGSSSLGRASETDMKKTSKQSLGICEAIQFRSFEKINLTMIALSNYEAEMVAALSGACEGMGLRQLWHWRLKFRVQDTVDPHAFPPRMRFCELTSTISTIQDASSWKQSFDKNGTHVAFPNVEELGRVSCENQWDTVVHKRHASALCA